MVIRKIVWNNKKIFFNSGEIQKKSRNFGLILQKMFGNFEEKN